MIDATALIGKPPGAILDWAGARYRAFRPTLSDMLMVLRRRAQIVTPKDAQFLLYLAGIGPGALVAEAGAGSGALTTVLAFAVGPAGAVVSFDRREEFLDVARRNVHAAGLADRVTFRVRDVGAEGIDLTGQDAIVLDLPEPWAVLASAKQALTSGGRIATYTPTYNQLERTVREMRTLGLEEVRSVELLERTLHVGDGGTRPEFDMLGHTGFLTGARKVD
ncbi:MAG: tRNA (adenine-N1)-methyltransferase [Thermoplasmata archaeon]|nr:tRNA (adenine-N1)-methyltransferase [Thermoplasmata archaeon]